jgi:hypothetical protein
MKIFVICLLELIKNHFTKNLFAKCSTFFFLTCLILSFFFFFIQKTIGLYLLTLLIIFQNFEEMNVTLVIKEKKKHKRSDLQF